MFVSGGCFYGFSELKGLSDFVKAPAGWCCVGVRKVKPAPFVYVEVSKQVGGSVVR